MDRSILYPGAKFRGFDFATGFADAETSVGTALSAVLGSNLPFYCQGGAVSAGPGSTIDVAPSLYIAETVIDPTAQGSIPQKLTTNYVAVYVGGSALTMNPPPLAAGQSVMGEVVWSIGTLDTIRSNDPSAGLLSFVNTANPTPGATPLLGPGGNDTTLPTVRRRVVNMSIVWGTASTSPTPPVVPNGSFPLASLLVPYGYVGASSATIQQAPALAGLLNPHHSGAYGQAPNIQIGVEIAASDTLGAIAAYQVYAGDPNGYVAGNASGGAYANAPPSMVWDSVNLVAWVCYIGGNAANARWRPATGSMLGETISYLPQVGAAAQQQVNFNLPDWAGRGFLEISAAGGKGGDGNGAAGSGASGGSAFRGWIGRWNVPGFTRGAACTLTYPSGGTASYAPGNVQLVIGGTSVCTGTSGTNGALGGQAVEPGSTTYGQALQYVSGLQPYAGQSGGNGVSVSDLLIGGAGGASMFGPGGLPVFTPNTSNVSSPGNGSSFFGGGGSGATGSGIGAQGIGGAMNLTVFP